MYEGLYTNPQSHRPLDFSHIYNNFIKKLLKFMINCLILGYALSCGINTAVYTYESKLDFNSVNKEIPAFILLLLSGLILNFILYSCEFDLLIKDFDKATKNNKKTNNKIKYFFAFVITAGASLASAVLSFHCASIFPSMDLDSSICYLLAICSGVATFALLFKAVSDFIVKFDFVRKIQSITQASKNSKSFFCKLLITGIISTGLYGLFSTTYDVSLDYFGQFTSIFLVATLAIAEVLFIWSTASGIVGYFTDKKNQKVEDNKHNKFLMLFGTIILLSMMALNGVANGILDAASFDSESTMWAFTIFGTLASICFMLKFFFENKASPAEIAKNMMLGISQKAYLFFMLSCSSVLAVPVMAQLKIDLMEVWLPCLLTFTVFTFCLYNKFNDKAPVIKPTVEGGYLTDSSDYYNHTPSTDSSDYYNHTPSTDSSDYYNHTPSTEGR